MRESLAAVWGLETGLRVGLRLILSRSAVVVAMGLDLLELVRGQDRGKLLTCLLVDRFHLLLHDNCGDCGVAGERGDLLITVDENGFNLRRLLGREIELFGESRGFALGIVGVVMFRCGGGGACCCAKAKLPERTKAREVESKRRFMGVAPCSGQCRRC